MSSKETLCLRKRTEEEELLRVMNVASISVLEAVEEALGLLLLLELDVEEACRTAELPLLELSVLADVGEACETAELLLPELDDSTLVELDSDTDVSPDAEELVVEAVVDNGDEVGDNVVLLLLLSLLLLSAEETEDVTSSEEEDTAPVEDGVSLVEVISTEEEPTDEDMLSSADVLLDSGVLVDPVLVGSGVPVENYTSR
jgi:hypothetical protein